MHTTPFSTLLDQLATELSALTPAVATDTTSRKRRPHTVRPGILDDKGLPLAWSEPTHDWAAYDSSDIHQRNAECEAQVTAIASSTKRAKDIETLAASKRPITMAQRNGINTVIEAKSPGLSIGEKVSERFALNLLGQFVGLDTAAEIMTASA